MSQFSSNVPGLPQPQNGNWIAAAAPEDSESNKFDFWGLINRRKWLIFLGMLTGVGIGLLYHYNTPPTFESTAQISIEPKNPYQSPLNAGIGNAMPDAANFGIRHDKFIDSPEFITQTLQDNDYFKLSSFANMTEIDAVTEAEKNLEVVPDREEPKKFVLSFKGSDKSETKMVLNSLIVKYEEKLKDKYRAATTNLITDFRASTEKIINKLNEANIEYETIRRAYPDALLGGTVSLEKEKLRSVDSEITEIQNQLYTLSSERQWIMDALENGQEELEVIWILRTDRKVLDDNDDRSFAMEQKRIADTKNLINIAELERVDVLQRLGSGHPTVQRLDRQIEFYNSLLENPGSELGADNQVTIEQMVRLYLSKIELNINESRIKLASLMQQFAALKKIVQEINDGEFLLMRKDEEIDMIRGWLIGAQTTLASIDPDQLEQLVNSKKEGYYFEILARPEDGRQVWPYLPAILAIGGLLGMLSGFGIGYLVDIADKTYRNPDEITKQLNLPLIGHIPIISSAKKNIVENSYIHPLVCTYHRPKSQSSEAFRAVRTALFFNAQGRDHSVIQVTSPTPGDGKSTCAVNIAVSIAQSGKRVLLIDGDMRRPTVHHSFGIKSTEGFSSVLAGDTRIEDAIFECEEIEGLSVMPCGRKPSNPAELLTSPRFQSLMEEVRQLFDFVIIDTPPVLAVTDPCPIAARVDGVILTLRIKKNIKISSDRATEILQNVGGNVIGVVVNGVGANTGYGSQYSYGAYRAGYSYNGYGYGYGYGYGTYYEDKNHGPSAKGAGVASVPNIAHQAAGATPPTATPPTVTPPQDPTP